MRFVLLSLLVATTAVAQTPTAIVRQYEQRRAQARRAVAQAVAAENQLAVAAPRRATVAVIADRTEGATIRGLGGGLADLLATDLARVHALRLVERMQAQAIIAERALAGTDEEGRPRAWHFVGASDVVVVDAAQSGPTLQLTARVVNLVRRRVDATVVQTGPLADLFNIERRLALDILRALGVEPTSAERRILADRPAANIDAFLAWAAAMDALESGDAPQADRLLRRALDVDAGINAVFDASVLAQAGLSASLAAVVPMPGALSVAGDDPTEAGLATEGNESEYGEAWFEGAGDRSLTLYEMTVPLSTSLPLARGRLDLATVWASSRADTPANDVFHAWGFTDVHVRFTQPLGASGVSFTVGGALPARDAHGADDDIRRVPISPDLLPTAMYRRRSAPSVSGGLFFTRPAGAWSWGAATGAEWSATYDEAAPSLHTIAIAPGMRWRVRADAARPLGDGRLALGASLMAFSPAKRAGAAITGGTRTLLRGSYALPVGAVDLEAGGWLLHASAVSSAGTNLRHASTITAGFANRSEE
ncbi:MAG: hypothetical protein ACYC7F_14160, partial [Gemmatimonadaceae bacterium]